MILILAINDPGQLLHFVPPPFVARSNLKSFMSRKILNVVIPDAFLNALICRSSNGSITTSV